MFILIDAYNLLKYRVGSPQVTLQQRQAFLAQLALYASLKGLEVMVVFDGGDAVRPEVTRYKGLTLVHSGYRIDADSYIIEYIDGKKNKAGMLVVSSDRNLCTAVKSRSVETINSPSFSALLTKATKEGVPVKRVLNQSAVLKAEGYESSHELDMLMVQAGAFATKKEDNGSLSHLKSKSYTVSKAEKKIQKIVKKL